MTQAQAHALQALHDTWPAAAATRLAGAIVAATRQNGAVLALDFDNTCVRGDFGEQLHAWLCERHAYALDSDAFWSTVHAEDGRDRLRAEWQRDMPRASVGHRAEFSAELIATYLRHLRRAGAESAFGWAATLHAGMTVEALTAHARQAFSAALLEPNGARTLTTRDGVTLRRPHGLRVRPALGALAAAAEHAGVSPWIVTATNEWAVAAVAACVGVPAERVIGNRCRVEDGVITVERDGPTTWRQGKVDALRARAGCVPAIAVGDTWSDVELLGAAQHLAVLIDRGDAQLRELATSRGWLVVSASGLDGD